MGKHSTSGSYGQRVKRIGCDHYRLSWTMDRYYNGYVYRFPTSYRRDTDRAGALRFCRKWGIDPNTCVDPAA